MSQEDSGGTGSGGIRARVLRVPPAECPKFSPFVRELSDEERELMSEYYLWTRSTDTSRQGAPPPPQRIERKR